MNLKPVKIGNAVIPHGLFLAPMAGFTDAEFRQICHECGAEFSVSEMISAKAVCYGDKKTFEYARLSSHSVMTALQLFGHDPKDIEEAARRLLGGYYDDDSPTVAGRSLPPTDSRYYSADFCNCPADCAEPQAATRSCDKLHSPTVAGRSLPPHARGVDINMGCPVKKIVGNGDGSALMLDPALCGRLVEAAVRGSGNTPVTVKIRAGFDADRKNAPEVARICAAAGAAAIFVHGRTREQFYAPSSDNSIIAAVRDAVPPEIPVIGNGDITTPEDADRMIRETGCDGIMIGRAALGDPWLFGRIAAAAEGIILPEPTISERLAMALRLCRDICAIYGEDRGVPMCRGRAGHFIRGIPGAAATRDSLCRARTLAEVEDCLRLSE